MAKFSAGDVVQLKSGGPSMTIDSHDDATDEYVCSWFDKSERMQARFQEPVLKLIEKNDG